jgi:cell division septation protein DedD
MRRLKTDVSHRMRRRAWRTLTTGWVGLFLGSGAAVILGLALGPSLAGWVDGSGAMRALTREPTEDAPALPLPTGAVGPALPVRPASGETRPGGAAATASAARPPSQGPGPSAAPLRFRIQVGAFADARNADRLVERLRGEGFGAATTVFEHDRFRVVRVGTFGSKEEADRALGALAGRGFSGLVVQER